MPADTNARNETGQPGTQEGEGTGGDGEELTPRPLVLSASPFAGAAQARLATELVTRGYSDAAAQAAARAVEDPPAVLEALRYPTEIGVHGGTISYVSCRVKNGTVLPLPFNPRVSGRIQYPAGGRRGGVEPLVVGSASDERPQIEVQSTSPATLRNVMQDGESVIRDRNDLRQSVRSQGILLPVTLAPVTFSFDSGDDDATAICAIDGSSRVTAALSAWSLRADEVLFHLSDPRHLREKTEEIRALAAHDPQDLNDDQQAALRNQVLPAQLIVGFSVYEQGLSFVNLIDAYLGLIHVEPPQPWGEGAEQDARAEAVLDELERRARIGTNERAYLAGLLEPEAATAAGFSPELDARAAAIFQAVDSRRNSIAINKALRRLGMDDPSRVSRLEVGTELSIRPYRLDVNQEVVRRGPRLALPQAMVGLPAGGWDATNRTPEDIRDAALAELEAGGPGRSCSELAVMGAFWLTRYAALQKSSRVDPRFADQLLRDILGSHQGIHVLYQSVVDGRAGHQPTKVRPDGTAERPVSGAVEIDDRWLRETFTPLAPAEPTPPPAGKPPAEVLADRLLALRAESEGLQTRVAALSEVEDPIGTPLVEVEGCPGDTADDIRNALRDVSDEVHRLKIVWQGRGVGRA